MEGVRLGSNGLRIGATIFLGQPRPGSNRFWVTERTHRPKQKGESTSGRFKMRARNSLEGSADADHEDHSLHKPFGCQSCTSALDGLALS